MARAQPKPTSGSRSNSKRGPSANKIGAPPPQEVQTCILLLIKELSGRVGRTTIAQILSGSRAKKIVEKDLDKNEFHGKFAGHGETKLVILIDQLVDAGEVSVSSGMYPKVQISPDGQKRLLGLETAAVV
jgi:superfamily II DNA helicase RecQ